MDCKIVDLQDSPYFGMNKFYEPTRSTEGVNMDMQGLHAKIVVPLRFLVEIKTKKKQKKKRFCSETQKGNQLNLVLCAYDTRNIFLVLLSTFHNSKRFQSYGWKQANIASSSSLFMNVYILFTGSFILCHYARL